MTDAGARPDREVRYEPDERPPTALAFGLGSQQAILCIAGVVLTPVIVIRAAGGNDSYMTWAVFAALLVSGLTTIMQAVRIGRIGAGYPLLMGTSGAFIAVCVTALVEGGPGLLATLVAISALFQFALSERLSLLRRIITPTVAGTVIMLIAVTVMPGVAARSVGMWIGILFVAAAFLPKVSALLLAIPSPVVAAYATVLLALLFVLGMRIVVQGGVDYRKATIAGTAFWLGTDHFGRDIFSRILWGARTTVLLSLRAMPRSVSAGTADRSQRRKTQWTEA